MVLISIAVVFIVLYISTTNKACNKSKLDQTIRARPGVAQMGTEWVQNDGSFDCPSGKYYYQEGKNPNEWCTKKCM